MPKTTITFEDTVYLPDLVDREITLSNSALIDLRNFRIRGGLLRRSDGYIDPLALFVPPTGTQTLTGNPVFATNMNFTNNAEIVYLATDIPDSPGSHNRFYKVTPTDDGRGIVDRVVTLGGNDVTLDDGSPYLWSSFNWGETTVFHNPRYPPYYLTAGTAENDYDFTGMPGWDTNDFTDFMFPLNAIIVGLGFRGDTPAMAGIQSDRVIITSNRITQFNEFPTWELGTDTASTSGIYPIDGFADGSLITGGPLENFAIAYTDSNAIRIDEEGGILTLSTIHSDAGVLSKNSWCQIPNQHFVVANNQIYVTDGNAKQIIGQDKWSTTFFSNINKERLEEVQCVYNPRHHAVWIKIPVGNTDNEIWVYDVDAGQIETVLTDQQEGNWLFFTTEGLPLTSLNTTAELPFDPADELYSTDGRAFLNHMIMMGSDGTTGSFYVHELGDTYNGASIDALARRDKHTPADAYAKQEVMQIDPYYTGEGSLRVTVGGGDNPGEVTFYYISRDLVSGRDQKMDVRFPAHTYLGIMWETSDRLSLSGYQVAVRERYKR